MNLALPGWLNPKSGLSSVSVTEELCPWFRLCLDLTLEPWFLATDSLDLDLLICRCLAWISLPSLTYCLDLVFLGLNLILLSLPASLSLILGLWYPSTSPLLTRPVIHLMALLWIMRWHREQNRPSPCSHAANLKVEFLCHFSSLFCPPSPPPNMTANQELLFPK